MAEYMRGHKDDAANRAVGEISAIVHKTIAQMDELPEKCVALVGSTITGIQGLAILFANEANQDRMCKQMKADDAAFGALYLIASLEEHSQGVVAGYSLDNVRKVQQMFRKLFGRDYTNLGSNLVEAMRRQDEAFANLPDGVPINLKKFLS